MNSDSYPKKRMYLVTETAGDTMQRSPELDTVAKIVDENGPSGLTHNPDVSLELDFALFQQQMFERQERREQGTDIRGRMGKLGEKILRLVRGEDQHSK